jgi:hypothetical protein
MIMAHFYGAIPVSGRKTTATARGHKNTGLVVQAATWQGAIEIELRYCGTTGQNLYTVREIPWHNSGQYREIETGAFGKAAHRG